MDLILANIRIKYGKKKSGRKVFLPLCAPLGARTLDTLIKSQVLYQLS